MSQMLIFLLHGLAYAGLLFLISSGLTLVFGMMNVLNFSHAAFYMLGAYFSFSILKITGNFWLSIIVCPILLFVIGALVERFLLRRVHAFGNVHELLLTFGLAYIITETVKWVWGNFPLAVSVKGFLAGNVQLFGLTYPTFRLFIISCAITIGLIMCLVIYKTRVGIIVRAAVNDSQMVSALGINVQFVFMNVFAAGAALSGFAGVIAGPLLTTYPNMANEILIDAFVVIVIGGFGSLGGALLASLIIGQLQTFGVMLIPKMSMALIYMLMAAVLIIKPSGLFGEE
ncbi:branched-chain amino acid ABC transporter permease [uncultured Desulfosarcina sp.]|uniref:branched-chain amino acid ABC transporter permease n=1 Tax=uncultured Desulfosarcina sp. TaxID=218289 RepID=UPI0029C62288|nr:branched-chain amino acid ABC transporter permease [uncultured Desulfosarcina sp.]